MAKKPSLLCKYLAVVVFIAIFVLHLSEVQAYEKLHLNPERNSQNKEAALAKVTSLDAEVAESPDSDPVLRSRARNYFKKISPRRIEKAYQSPHKSGGYVSR